MNKEERPLTRSEAKKLGIHLKEQEFFKRNNAKLRSIIRDNEAVNDTLKKLYSAVGELSQQVRGNANVVTESAAKRDSQWLSQVDTLQKRIAELEAQNAYLLDVVTHLWNAI
jgi:hypothetical protein